jgi:tetratricopeptide (TPR) repeat protein
MSRCSSDLASAVAGASARRLAAAAIAALMIAGAASAAYAQEKDLEDEDDLESLDDLEAIDDLEDDAATEGGDDAAAFAALVESGGKLFRDGKWAEARAKWEQAYELRPKPTLMFNIASTYRRAGDSAEAIEHYKKYLEIAPADAPYRSLAEDAVINLQRVIDAEKRAAEAEKRATTQPAPPPPAPRASASRGTGLIRWTGAGLAGVGAVSLGVGLYRGFEARDLQGRFESLVGGNQWTQELEDDYRRGESLERQAIIFSVVGGVALAVGGGLLVAGLLQSGDDSPVAVAPFITGNRAGLAIAGGF